MSRRKLIIICCLICVGYYVPLFADLYRISDVEVKGNINVKEKTILKKIKSRPGNLYSEKILKIDTDKILKLGFFEDITVEVDTTTYKITFIVKEKPLIKKIAVKGNKKISKGAIKSKITTKTNEHFDRIKLDIDKQKVLDFYSEKGYSDTDVEYSVLLDEMTNKVELIFLVSEGKKVIVGKVKITGTKRYKPKKILRKMGTKRKKVFKQKKLAEDIDKIIGFYKKNGFESVKVSTPTIEYNEERTKVNIKLNVNEGPKYKIGNIQYSGNNVYTNKELRKVMMIKKNKKFNNEKIETSQQNIAQLYADKGYLRASVVPIFYRYPEKGVLNIKFEIEENFIVYVDRIYIDGLTHTKEFVIRREILLKQGNVFSGTKIRRSLEKIYNLGFIDEVKVDIQDTGKPDRADIVFSIAEGKPGMLSAGAGYSSVDQFVGTLQVSHMNLFGRAQRLNLLWEFGERKKNYDISWTEPWFLHKPVSLGIGLHDVTRVREYGPIYRAYKEERKGAEIRVGPRLTEYFSLLSIYSYGSVSIFDVDSRIESSVEETEDLTSSFTQKIIYDTRDNVFDPTRGNRNSLSVQLSGGPFGGDVHFYKPLARSSWYFPVFWKFVLTGNINFGFIEGIDRYDLKNVPYEKFYVGGPDTVRGYRYRELSPDDGGKVMTVCNIEYKIPIVRERNRTIIQGAIFYDFGGAWSDFNNYKYEIGETDEWKFHGQWDNYMKSGWGFGIRFTTPVFPIRLDWGWPFQPTPGQIPPEFYFTIGQIF